MALWLARNPLLEKYEIHSPKPNKELGYETYLVDIDDDDIGKFVSKDMQMKPGDKPIKVKIVRARGESCPTCKAFRTSTTIAGTTSETRRKATAFMA